MSVSVKSRFELADVAPKIGSAIHTDKQTLLTGVPEINLTNEEQIAFTAYAHHSGRLMHRTKLEGEESFA
jgi:hypothetical protein